MCGIAGYFDGTRREAFEARALIRRMTDAIAHRGPDGEGAHVAPEAGVVLGHRRLSIIDISEAGAQPMTSHDDRWVLVFNGELYNFEELRRTLEQDKGPVAWRGHSDTEVLLECVSAWGIERALKSANGMFALALWDRRDRILILARDRMGEKPLYYGWQGPVFLFGSELKALAAHPAFQRRLDVGALALYLTYAYIPAPLSIYTGIHKLLPGHTVSLHVDGPSGEWPKPAPYWTLPLPRPQPRKENDALCELDELLRESVRIRMRADVPMGAFLSGGIDSSTVVSLMQQQAERPVRTFSIGFKEEDYDESTHAALVASHLGTQHTEFRVTGGDAIAVIPELARIYDEPFADSSQIPTYLLSKLTREDVTVSLSGDGGDEVFAGYTRYFTFNSIWPRIERIPSPLRRPAAAILSAVPASVWHSIPAAVPANIRREIQDERLQKLAAALRARTAQEYFATLARFWNPREILRVSSVAPEIFVDRYDIVADFENPALGMSYVDMGSYLPDDILAKVDRATMAVSLEGRIPILDHRVVEFAATLPLSLKIRNGTGKYLLRSLLREHVPDSLIDRPKKGFSVPLGAWLRRELKPWGDDLLYGKDTALTPLLELDRVRAHWQAHQSGRRDHAHRLWIILILLDWARHWRPLVG